MFLTEVRPELDAAGIHIIDWDQVTPAARERLSAWFSAQVFPVLTPLAVDPAHPFPYISGLSLNLAVLIRNPKTGKEHFARVKVPPIFARFVPVGNQRFVPLEDVIREHLRRLLARDGMRVVAFASGDHGTGTTTAVVNIAAALAACGRRVLAIDESGGPESALARRPPCR